jgi:hypothetical protein
MISIVKNGITNDNKQTTENLLNWCIFSFSNKVIANSKIAKDAVDLIKVYHFFFFRMAVSIIFFNSLQFLCCQVGFVRKEGSKLSEVEKSLISPFTCLEKAVSFLQEDSILRVTKLV